MKLGNRFSVIGKVCLGVLIAASSLTIESRESRAAVIGIVDSGTDFAHPELTLKKWINAAEKSDGADNDNNGYADDFNGWNFAENSNELVDLKYLNTYNDDVVKYFDIQAKAIRGTATEEEKLWVKTKMGDQAFTENLQKFGNFMHGTHVTGITVKNVAEARAIGIKLIPTEQKKPFALGFKTGMKILGLRSLADLSVLEDSGNDFLVKMGISFLAQQQGKAIAPIGLYLKTSQAQVANCSFGMSYQVAKVLLQQLLSQFLGDVSDEKLDEYAKFFVSEVAKNMGDGFIKAAPQTLFAIAAGNDGTDNDVFPASPANVKMDNTITVAATLGRASLARFSNFGVKMVEVAAPGVAILSTIPGGKYLHVSGTSQATPYVAQAAGRVVDGNPALSPAQVKKVLMGTVDKKDFLVGKVLTGGMVNPNRAAYAAAQSKTLSLDAAIAEANAKVADEVEGPAELAGSLNADSSALGTLFVSPLAPIFE